MVEELLNQVSTDRIRQHIHSLEGIRHPTAAPQALERAASYIRTSFESLNYPVEAQSFDVDGVEFSNIIATRTGARLPEERWLAIAHYDTVQDSPGADDNASGVAALLELARLLEPFDFGRTVQFAAVNLEERQKEGPLEQSGLFGSRALAAEAEKQNWKISGVVVFESIAFAGKQIVQTTPASLPLKLPEYGDFLGVIGNQASSDLVTALMQAVERYGIGLPIFPLVVPGNGEMLQDTRRSDHAPFWDRGFKAVMLTDTANFRNPHYHKPTDTLETLNIPFAAQVCCAVAGMLMSAAA